MEMLRSLRRYDEMAAVYYSEVLERVMRSEVVIESETVGVLMRCSQMASDWETLSEFMRIHIENEWPFHKMSARFALECCLKFDGIEFVEKTVMEIWRSLTLNDVPNEHCFIQFVLCLKLKFVDVELVRMAMLSILEELNRSLMMNGKRPLIAVIFSEMMDCAERQRLDDVALRIADRGVEAMSTFNGQSLSNRYKAVPLRFMVKSLSFYQRTNRVDRVHDLFVAIKRFRNSAAANAMDSDSKIWEKELWNEQTLPILVRIYFNYFYRIALCGVDGIDSEPTPSRALLTRYRNEADSICKFINYSISTPMASLYLIGIDYLMERVEAANAAMFSVVERDSSSKKRLLCQWPDGHFVLNLLPNGSLQIPDVVFVPLIVSTLSVYAEHIANAKNERLKSIKIKMDSDQWLHFQSLFGFLTENFPPKIDYRITGKIPESVLVIELERRSLWKWSELHHIQRDHILTQTVRCLLPKIFGNRQSTESHKELLSSMKQSISSSAQRGGNDKTLTD